jgi:hypothetical protein
MYLLIFSVVIFGYHVFGVVIFGYHVVGVVILSGSGGFEVTSLDLRVVSPASCHFWWSSHLWISSFHHYVTYNYIIT